MSVRCLFGHYWIGRPPFGLTRQGPLCWRTCKRCGKRSFGLGYHEQDWSWAAPLDHRPEPGEIPPVRRT